jgi:hypothetical protein
MPRKSAPKKAAPKQAKVEPRIVEAVGSAGASGRPGVSARQLDEAMGQAAAQAQSEGITDPDEIRARMLKAKDEALKGAG